MVKPHRTIATLSRTAHWCSMRLSSHGEESKKYRVYAATSAIEDGLAILIHVPSA
jgi:hypothetical protein